MEQQLLSQIETLADQIVEKDKQTQSLKSQLHKEIEFTRFLQSKYTTALEKKQCPSCGAQLESLLHSDEVKLDSIRQEFDLSYESRAAVAPVMPKSRKHKKQVCSKCKKNGHSRSGCPEILGLVGVSETENLSSGRSRY